MKAYKVFNPDWTCKEFQYAVGEEYEIDGEVEMCENGFHSCKKLVDCFSYYDFNVNNKMAEVLISGTILGVDDDKQCSGKIKVVKEITWEECLILVNSGNRNSGYRNSGNRNSGNRNSGDWNSGHRNSGHRNSGHWNSGDRNSGHSNSGHWNSGDSNSGDRNSGDRNSGHWNSGDRNSGYFNTSIEKKVKVFNGNYVNRNSFLNERGVLICQRFDIKHYHKKVNGIKRRFLHSYKNSWKLLFNELTKKEIISIKEISHFDSDIFFEITGVSL